MANLSPNRKSYFVIAEISALVVFVGIGRYSSSILWDFPTYFLASHLAFILFFQSMIVRHYARLVAIGIGVLILVFLFAGLILTYLNCASETECWSVVFTDCYGFFSRAYT